MGKSISDFIMDYFNAHIGEELEHGPVVDWVTYEWLKTHKDPPRDIWRAIRHLYEVGTLQKISKGIYLYEPELVNKKELEDFSTDIKEQIFKRDDYRCVICGRGLDSGFEIHADHINPKSKFGDASLENGQTLCSMHNFRKKNYGQTETGKKFFIRLLDLAKKLKDQDTIEFCKAILETYDEYQINGHIEWKSEG